MPATTDPADAAYLAQRKTMNVRWRWRYAVALLCVATVMGLSHVLNGSIRPDGALTRPECYALAFGYLGVIAMLALFAGGRPLAHNARLRALLDDAWMALLMPGAAALVTLDAPTSDLSGYAMVCLPMAILHSSDARPAIALQLFGFVCAAAGIVLYGGLDAGPMMLILSLVGACTAVFAYLAVVIETGRRNAFITARELELRSSALLEANAQLESNNRKLELRTAELARLIADLEENTAALESANRRLEELAGTDPLTGVANRRQLFEALEREFGRARRHGNDLALAVIDLDDFGPVNKMHGVIAGDEVLAEFAAALRAQARAADLVARYGGEEFVVLMPDCSAAAAVQLLERVRCHIADEPLGSRRIAITFSAGVAELAAEDTAAVSVLDRADTALRHAKAQGKNRVARH